MTSLKDFSEKHFAGGAKTHVYLLAVIPLCDGVAKSWGKGVRDSLSSLGSGRLPIPVEALPADKFLLCESSVRLEERE